MPFVMTIDQQRSRTDVDRVEGLLAELGRGTWDVVLPFQRTVGDECQGAVAEPLAVIDIALWLLREHHWTVGIGIGSMTPAASGRTAEASGPAFYAAREAVEAAKGADPPVEIRSQPGRGLTDDIDSLFRVLARMALARTLTQWAVVEGIREDLGNGAYRMPRGKQKRVAAELRVTPQAVSKAYRASGWEDEYAARTSLANLLARLHEDLEETRG